MSRLLVIPAAGLGSRLGSSIPKVLVQVADTSMLDRLLHLYRQWADRVIVVINPTSADMVRRHVAAHPDATRIECVEQVSPTGMLDAILLGIPAAARYNPSSIWVTWCDQVAVHPKTIERLAARTSPRMSDAMVLPTVTQREPYIHLERADDGRIVRVLHRREGDHMPETGESDMGLFALSPNTYFERLPEYAESVEVGRATRERNFLPFIPWLARIDTVTTFPSESPMEAVGINTPQELASVESYLRSIGRE
jgi:bifunctional UDP-N-acetylglucosamine pyrophosphorylase/glucosamine-1-phosphate N-acetyltransferase